MTVESQHFARRREFQVATRSIEQRDAKLGFEQEKLAADGGGRDIEIASGGTNRTSLRYRKEIAVGDGDEGGLGLHGRPSFPICESRGDSASP